MQNVQLSLVQVVGIGRLRSKSCQLMKKTLSLEFVLILIPNRQRLTAGGVIMPGAIRFFLGKKFHFKGIGSLNFLMRKVNRMGT